MSEGVKLLISADDQASKVVDNVTENIDNKVKRIKEVGGRAKASTEFIGTLANTLGGSQLGAYAGTLGQLTEKISAFSEVSKAGGAGALAFKAGLVGVAAVGAWQVGKMIGNWVFETEKFSKQIQEANQQLEKAASTAAQIAAMRLSFASERIELIDDPEAQDAAFRKRYTQLTQLAGEQEKAIEQIKRRQEAETTAFEKTFGLSEEVKASREAEIAAATRLLEVTEAEQAKISEKIAVEAIEIRQLKEKAALKERNEGTIDALQKEIELLKASKEERAAIEALQKTGGDTEAARRVEALLREKDALLEMKEAEKLAADEAKKANDEKLAQAKRVEELRNSELQRLKEERILIEDGASAAKMFALQQAGIDRATAQRIADEEESLRALRAERQEKPDDQAAVQSRLMTRGGGNRDEIEKRQLAVQEMMVRALQVIERNTDKRYDPLVRLEVVGA